MTCPVCGGRTKVGDSRQPDVETVKRRRDCLDCGYRFYTIEVEVDSEQRAQNPSLPTEALQRLAALHESAQVCIKQLLSAAEIKI